MRDKTRTRLRVSEIAARQHGVVASTQLAELGWSRSRISHAVGLGRLHRVHQGVFAAGHPALTSHGRCLAAVLACKKGAALSHLSAAWLWGLVSGCGEDIDVTAAAPRHPQAGIRVHSAKTLAREDTTITEGIAVTAIPRTLLDLAGTSPRTLGRALSNCNRLGQLDMVSIDALIARSAGLRGVARLRLALEDFREPAFTRSGLERRFLRVVRKAGLPRPSTNLFVEGYELDAYWPAERFAVELDSYEHHGDRQAFEADRIRQENLKLAGIEMIRVTALRLEREPRVVMQRLRKLLEQRR